MARDQVADGTSRGSRIGTGSRLGQDLGNGVKVGGAPDVDLDGGIGAAVGGARGGESAQGVEPALLVGGDAAALGLELGEDAAGRAEQAEVGKPGVERRES